MRKHILLGGAAVVAVVLSLGTAADAQRGGGRGPAAGEPGVTGAQPRGGRGQLAAPEARLARQLDLTAEQREAVGAILRASRDRTAPLVDQLRLAQQNLRRAVFADTRDEAAVAALSNEVASLQQQIADLRLEAQAGVSAELTEEQRIRMRAAPARGRGPMGIGAGLGGPAGHPNGPGAGRGNRGQRG
jgi:Spy/CpxP family protein refolding chaperone